MGQQQLLLLVLSTVIVGLATVAGIQAFEQGSVRANQDALTNTAVKIASDIQAKANEPSQFGGYDGILKSANAGTGETAAENNVTLSAIGYETTDNSVFETADGECGISTGGSNTPTFSNGGEATGASGTIIVTCASEDNNVSVGISNLDSDGISTFAESNGS